MESAASSQRKPTATIHHGSSLVADSAATEHEMSPSGKKIATTQKLFVIIANCIN